MEINKEIHKKAKAIIERNIEIREYISTCHDALICPECGKALEAKISNGFYLTTHYYCSSCSYRG